MAKDVERLVLELSADVAKLDRGMRQGQRIAEQRTRAIERSFADMNTRTSRSASDMATNIRTAIAGIALGAAAREVQQYADAWTRLGNPLRAAGASQVEVNSRMDELVAISLRSRSSLEGTVILYNRLIAASGELGVSQQQVARVVETVNKALATSNMNTGERTSALTQLAQGLGSGNLAGDELKAIRENSQVLSQAIADEFDTTIGGLKKLGEEGALTSARVFKAIENAAAGTDAAFARTTATIGDSFTNLETRAIQYVGKLDAATGASEKFASLLGFIANNLDAFGDAAVMAATVVGGALAGRAMVAAIAGFTGLQVQIAVTNAQLIAFEITSGLAAGSLGRLTVAGVAGAGAMRTLSASMAFLGGPIGLAIIAVAAGIYLLRGRTIEASEAMAELAPTVAANSVALQNYEDAQIKARDASAKHATQARATAAAMREEATAALTAARALAAERTAAANARVSQATEAATSASERAARFGQGPFSNSSAIAMQAEQRRAQTAQKQQRDAQAVAGAAIRESIRMEQEIQRISAGIDLGGARGGGGGGATEAGAGKGSKSSGPSAAELAAQREMLRLQGAEAVLRAQGRTYDADQIKAAIDILNLTKQLKDAGVENAASEAAAQVNAVRLAEAANAAREAGAERAEFFIEAAKVATEKYNDELERQLGVQIQLATLAGDETLVRRLERELALRQQLRALGPDATAAQKGVVRADAGRINAAEDRQILVEQGREMASSFVDILRADDIGAEIGNRFRAAAFDKLEDVFANVFASLMGGQQGGAGGGGITGLITSTIGGFFGGRRALGGNVSRGKFYKVNENTPNSEFFAPKSDGYVGNLKPQQAQASRGPVSMTFRTEYNLQGAAGTEAILGTVQRMQSASERRILSTVQAAAPSAQLQNQLLRE